MADVWVPGRIKWNAWGYYCDTERGEVRLKQTFGLCRAFDRAEADGQ